MKKEILFYKIGNFGDNFTESKLMVLFMNDRVKILLLMIFYTPIVLIVFGAVMFIPANDFLWLEAWIFIIIFFTYVFLYLLYSLIKDPELLLKRGKYLTDDPDTKSFSDKTFMILATIAFVFIIIFPGIEHRLGVSPLHWSIELIGVIGMIFGLIGMTYVNYVNRYASKGLIILSDHELITSGPYQYVRHPMYLVISIFAICLPLSLGSFITFLVSFVFPILLIYRTSIEEKMLIEHLPGYKKYMEDVKYRLIPKIY